jgi:hypothetical protein
MTKNKNKILIIKKSNQIKNTKKKQEEMKNQLGKNTKN